ncbi:MAG: 23S rRNA (pseudouridine(1915)-N(3))-methyltransferase RlmH [Paludibacteraceae bacterium]|nr:23S rRNA (pseudouridine(1915)-N(3))-methyltransferase RlmH [Paludibacteraceae bacterium]
MKITILVVGKTTDLHLNHLISDYIDRIGHYVPVEFKALPELRNASSLSFEQQKQAEAEIILRAIDGSAINSKSSSNCKPSTNKSSSFKRNDRVDVILLDEHGQELGSIEFAHWLEKKQSASRDLVFVIGGPFGFSEGVYSRASSLISLSRMTFSHQMIRLLFAEQLYRAMTIIRGEKYHHE